MNEEINLLRRAQERDAVALGRIFDRYYGRMYGYIYGRIGHRETAEDLAAEVFLRMLEALSKGRFARTSLQAWLYRIAHNLVADHYRSHRPDRVPLGPEIHSSKSTPSEIAEAKSDHEAVRRALAHLTRDQQQVIALRFGQRMKAKEVGEVLGKSEEAVRKLQSRGLASLRRKLERIR